MKPFPWWMRLLLYPLTVAEDEERVACSRFCWREDQGMFVLSTIGVINGIMPSRWYVMLYQRANRPWRLSVQRRPVIVGEARLRARVQ